MPTFSYSTDEEYYQGDYATPKEAAVAALGCIDDLA